MIEAILSADEMLPDASEDMTFPGRKLTFPIVLDDKWGKEALERYMHSIRDKAVYLPSNIDYLARNNGVEGGAEEALRLLVKSPWVHHSLLSLPHRSLILICLCSSSSELAST